MSETAGPPRAAPEVSGRRLAAVVIVNYGSHELVRRVTEELGDVQIVVVDNFTTHAERQAVQELGQARGWAVVANTDNRGFGAGCNAGAVRAWSLGCDHVILLNPDAMLTAAAVSALSAMVSDGQRVVVSPRITATDGAEVFSGARLNMKDGRIRSKRSATAARPLGAETLSAEGTWVPWLTGACFAMHRSLWDELGGFREPFFLYWEDVDITVRAFRAGADLVVRHDLVALHDEGGTQGHRAGRAKSAVYYDWNCRNRLRFAGSTLSRGEIVRWILSSPAVSWEILMRGGRRQLVSRPGLLWAAIRGTAIGLILAVCGLIRPASIVPTRATRTR